MECSAGQGRWRAAPMPVGPINLQVCCDLYASSTSASPARLCRARQCNMEVNNTFHLTSSLCSGWGALRKFRFSQMLFIIWVNFWWLIKSKIQLSCEPPSVLEGINGGQNWKVLSSVHFFNAQLQKRGFGAKSCLQLAAVWQAPWLASTTHTCLHCWSPLWKHKGGSEHYRRIGITKLV